MSDTETTNSDQREANESLIEAYYNNDHEGVIRAINEGADVNMRHLDMPILTRAARDGKVSLVQALLQAGANPNLADSSGWSPLHDVANTAGPEKYTEIARLLLEHGASVDAKNIDDGTPLIYACTQGPEALGLMKILLDHGADPNLNTFMGPPLAFKQYEIHQLMKQYVSEPSESSSSKALGCLTLLLVLLSVLVITVLIKS